MAEYSQASTSKAQRDIPGLGVTMPEEEAVDRSLRIDVSRDNMAASVSPPSFAFPLSNHTGISLRNLINMLFTYGDLINRAIGSHFYVNEELTDVLKGLELDGEGGIPVVKMAVKDTEIERHPVYGASVISGLSITENVVCFDGFEAPEADNPSLPYFEEDYVEACRQLAEAMNRIAISSTRIQAKTIQMGNDKYALHTWLNRLGMKGSEYKTTRKVLTYRLEGVMSHKTEDALIKATGRTFGGVKYKKRRPAQAQVNPEANSVDVPNGLASEKPENYDTERPQERMIMGESVMVEEPETEADVSGAAQTVPAVQSLSTDEMAGDKAPETENFSVLSPEIRLEIASVNDKDELARREAEVRADLSQIETQSGQLEKAISKASADIKSTQEKIANLQARLAKKQDSLQTLQTQFDAARQSRSLKTQELAALEKQQKTLDARALFDAFIASGKSMDEILGFLRGQAEQSSAMTTAEEDLTQEPTSVLAAEAEKESEPDETACNIEPESKKSQEKNVETRQPKAVSEPADAFGGASLSAQTAEGSIDSVGEDTNVVPEAVGEPDSENGNMDPQAISSNENIDEEKIKAADKDADGTSDDGSSEQYNTETPTKMRRKRGSLVLAPEQERAFQALWQQIVDAQGEEFYTMKGLPFQYEVRGRQIFVNRKGKAITESSLRLAFHQIQVGEISGPHSLKTFGASYVWSIFKKFGIVNS